MTGDFIPYFREKAALLKCHRLQARIFDMSVTLSQHLTPLVHPPRNTMSSPYTLAATQAAEQHPAGDTIADVEQPLLPPGDADTDAPAAAPAPVPAVSPDKPPRPIPRINSLSNLVQVHGPSFP